MQTASLRFTPWFTHWYQFYIPLQEREAELQETLRKARLDQGNLRGDPPVSGSVLRCHTADAECDEMWSVAGHEQNTLAETSDLRQQCTKPQSQSPEMFLIIASPLAEW